MDYQPHNPSQPALHLHFTKFRNSTVTSYCRHRAQITIMERFHLLSFFKTYQVLCQQFALLDSDLCQLRVPVRITFISRLNTLITDSKHIIHSFYTVKLIYFNTSATTYQRWVHVTDSYSGNTTYPNKSTCSDFCSIFEYNFMVAIVYHSLIQQNIHSHLTKKFFRVQ